MLTFFREWIDPSDTRRGEKYVPLCERFDWYILTGQVTSVSLYCNYQNESDNRKTWVPNLPIRLNIWIWRDGFHYKRYLSLEAETESSRPWLVGSRGSRLTRQPPNFLCCYRRGVSSLSFTRTRHICVINIWIAQFTVKHIQFETMVRLKCKPNPH
jgi:hypothetical protein